MGRMGMMAITRECDYEMGNGVGYGRGAAAQRGIVEAFGNGADGAGQGPGNARLPALRPNNLRHGPHVQELRADAGSGAGLGGGQPFLLTTGDKRGRGGGKRGGG